MSPVQEGREGFDSASPRLPVGEAEKKPVTSKQRLAWDDFAGPAPQPESRQPEIPQPAKPVYKPPEVGSLQS